MKTMVYCLGFLFLSISLQAQSSELDADWISAGGEWIPVATSAPTGSGIKEQKALFQNGLQFQPTIWSDGIWQQASQILKPISARSQKGADNDDEFLFIQAIDCPSTSTLKADFDLRNGHTTSLDFNYRFYGLGPDFLSVDVYNALSGEFIETLGYYYSSNGKNERAVWRSDNIDFSSYQGMYISLYFTAGFSEKPGVVFNGYIGLDNFHLNTEGVESSSRQTSTNIQEPSGIVAYPNPIRDVLLVKTVNLNNESIQVLIYDGGGNLILEKQFTGHLDGELLQIPVQQLGSGAYLLELRSGSDVFTELVIRN